ncbi:MULTISPECIES: tetratricopeptide repeat protein [Nocardiopsis]|uniref:Orc1-like AAA ATPase domain-containing protein n=1 Tax=Nocardiopsis sinuspersici TaxID=501010 RepID=A0A1V3BVP5_9ACTN|nr:MULTISPECIES: tetratricopeptide repeat protein [Nocardiopsis]OOC52488.1 hypothetical protein NOSIN_00425 [Nocardiopsis sinuspersici]
MQDITTNRIGPNNSGTAVQARTVQGGIGNTTNTTHLTTVQQERSLPLAKDAVPAPPSGFVGRDDELAALLKRLNPEVAQDGGSGAVVVSAVSGMGGVGKTALALKAAQTASEADWFCAHLFVDLHGYTPHTPPLTGASALDVLLRQVGVDLEDIPAEVGQRASFYRSGLQALSRADERHRPVLVVADNACCLDQVRPLLPGPGGHRLLVTSREALAIDGHSPLTLDTLPPDKALALLRARLDPADPRRDKQEELEGLAKRCGYLPLALKIAAALLARPLRLDPERLVARLVELSRFADDEHDLSAVFTASLEHLPADRVRAFALLGSKPGPDISTAMAAVMVAAHAEKSGEVEGVLEELAGAHLITSTGPGRWGMHDLLAEHACTLTPPDIDNEASREGHDATADARQQALDRVLFLYTTVAVAAGEHLRARKGGPPLQVFSDKKEVLWWLDTEIDNLLACVRTAHHTRRIQIAMLLPSLLGDYLGLRRRLDDAVEVHALALESAQQVGNVHNEAVAWNNLGIALRQVRRFGEAIDALTRARDLYQQTDDAHGEASAWTNLGTVLWQVRRFGEAISTLTRTHEAFRQIGDAHGEASAWTSLGIALQEMGRFGEAIDALTRARDLYQQTDDAHGEASAWNNLGIALRQVRRFGEAIDALTRARDLYQQTDDAHGEASAWTNLGSALQLMGRSEEALAACQHALDYCRQAGDTHGEAQNLMGIGAALLSADQIVEAVEALTRALELFEATGDDHLATITRVNLARVQEAPDSGSGS